MNIPVVGQTFEIDGYKSIQCTANANEDAKTFAKANGIEVAEAKYILSTLYGDARQSKVGEGVTDKTPDEESDVDGTNDEIMAAIDSLTASLKGNDNVNKSILTQITNLLKKLVGINKTTKTNTTSNSQNSTNTTVDSYWSKLEVEGKGVNLNNITNIIQNAIADYKAANNNKVSYDAIYQSLSAEEKAVVDKFLPNGNSATELKYLFTFFDNGGKDNRNGADVTMVALAAADTDGDGFLTDTEIRTVSRDIQKMQGDSTYFNKIGYTALDKDTKNKVITTTVNGKTVYFTHYSGSEVGGLYIALTADEMKILDKYLNDENKDNYVGAGKRKTGADIEEIWTALGTKFVKTFGGETRGREVLTNSAGITSVIFSNEDCSACDEYLYAAYSKIKKAMENN